MEIERCNASEPSTGIQVPHGRQRSDLICLWRPRWAQSPSILHWHAQPLHERARVQAEALLPGDQRIAVVRIFHLPLRRIARHSDIVVRPYHQTSSLPRQKFTNRFNFCWDRLLLCDHVIQTKNHHRIGVAKDLVVRVASADPLGQSAGKLRLDVPWPHRRCSETAQYRQVK